MAKYAYPAVFTPEEAGGYSVSFRDLEGCYTCGDNIEDAIYMAEDVLALCLWDYENEKKNVPLPSVPGTIELKDGEFVSFIRAGVNFSQVLQEALKQKLGLVSNM